MTAYDLVLRGGHIVAGTGDGVRRGDVAVTGNRVAAVGPIPRDVSAGQEIDLTGHYVAPGLVDAHVHADGTVFDPDVQLALLRQGVTTVLIGQDGISYAPSGPSTLAYVEDYFAAVNARHPRVSPAGCSVAELLATYDRHLPLNVGYLAPHGTIRHHVMGLADTPPTQDELQAMVELLKSALDDGALGLSTGLTYLPGALSETDELVVLCRLVAETGGVHVTHMRGYDDQVREGMRETCSIAEATGCPTHVSHYHGPGGLLVELLDDALERGLDITFDTYPYLRGSSLLAGVALPAWVQLNGPEATVRRLADPDVRRRLAREWFPTIRETVLTRARLSRVGADELRWAEGMTLTDAASRVGLPVEDFACQLFQRAQLDVGCVIEQSGTSAQGVRQTLRHPAHMGGSDGIYIGSHPHPRGWGTFARFLGHHTRALGDYDWDGAIRHLATAPARRFGLAERGVLRPGAVADLVAIDPEQVADTATYERPRSLAVGVPHAVVGGQLVLRDAALTGATPGRALRRAEVTKS